MSLSAQKRKKVVTSVFAGLIAGGAFLFLLTSGHNAAGPAILNAPASAQEAVVVANANLAIGAQIGANSVTTELLPVASVPDGAYATAAGVVGKYAAIAITARTAITAAMVRSDQSDALSTAVSPPLTLACPGDVAISVPFDEATGAGGYVTTGQLVDIIVQTADGAIHYGFNQVRVLKVGSHSQVAAGPSGPSTAAASLLVLELPRNKAAVMAYLVNTKGSPTGAVVRYVIASDDAPADAKCTPPTTNNPPITSRNWFLFLDS